MNEIKLEPNERLDDLHRNGYHLIQNPKYFCFGVDAVLLSGFTHINDQEIVLDLGCGSGVIPILLEAKTKAAHITGIEIQKECVEMARRSVELNGLSNKIKIIEGDIKNLKEIFKPSSFDVITTNPPYINNGGGLVNKSAPKAIARHEILCTLTDVISGTSKLLKTGGRFYMIHKPYRLTDIFICLREHKLEPKTMRFIHPYLDKEPTMVLIEAVRSGKAMIKILPPLIIYKEKGEYTQEVYKIYYE